MNKINVKEMIKTVEKLEKYEAFSIDEAKKQAFYKGLVVDLYHHLHRKKHKNAYIKRNSFDWYFNKNLERYLK